MRRGGGQKHCGVGVNVLEGYARHYLGKYCLSLRLCSAELRRPVKFIKLLHLTVGAVNLTFVAVNLTAAKDYITVFSDSLQS